MTDRFWTIPNILSLYRITAAPVIAFCIVACIEVILILLILQEPRSDVKGLCWVLRERRSLS